MPYLVDGAGVSTGVQISLGHTDFISFPYAPGSRVDHMVDLFLAF